MLCRDIGASTPVIGVLKPGDVNIRSDCWVMEQHIYPAATVDLLSSVVAVVALPALLLL